MRNGAACRARHATAGHGMVRAAWVRGCQVASFSFWLGQAGGRGASFVFGGGSGVVVTHAVAMQLLAMRPANTRATC
eukprot:2114111-Prymnesium_polylepis.1